MHLLSEMHGAHGQSVPELWRRAGAPAAPWAERRV